MRRASRPVDPAEDRSVLQCTGGLRDRESDLAGAVSGADDAGGKRSRGYSLPGASAFLRPVRPDGVEADAGAD